MNKYPAVFALLLIATCVILFSGGWAAQHKVFWSGDETISYLCATGNQEQYNTVASQTTHTPVNTTEWKKLLSIQEPYCFEKIATELSISDLHPPLYFWLLHLYLLTFGFSVQAGVYLNILLHLLSLLALYALGRQLSFAPKAAATICVLWAISPAALSVDFYARQYALLGLIHLLYAVCFLAWMQKPSKATILLLVSCATLGFLTHYSFIYTTAGYFGWALLQYKRIGRNQLIALATTYLLAGLLLSLLHPHFAHQFVLQQQRAQSFEVTKLLARGGKTLLTFCNVIVPMLLLKQFLMVLSIHVQLAIAGIGLAGIVTYAWLQRRIGLAWIRKLTTFSPSNMSFPVFISLWIGLVSVLPYLLFITPFHAMGAPYLVCAYPFLAILLYKLIGDSLRRTRVVAALMLAGSGLALYVFTVKQTALIPLRNQLTEAVEVVSDHSDRRNMGRIIPYLPSNQTISIEQPLRISTDTRMHHPRLFLQSAYEQPSAPVVLPEVYYDFEDWGGLITRTIP